MDWYVNETPVSISNTQLIYLSQSMLQLLARPPPSDAQAHAKSASQLPSTRYDALPPHLIQPPFNVLPRYLALRRFNLRHRRPRSCIPGHCAELAAEAQGYPREYMAFDRGEKSGGNGWGGTQEVEGYLRPGILQRSSHDARGWDFK